MMGGLKIPVYQKPHRGKREIIKTPLKEKL
jgi:hypothetical protein